MNESHSFDHIQIHILNNLFQTPSVTSKSGASFDLTGNKGNLTRLFFF